MVLIRKLYNCVERNFYTKYNSVSSSSDIFLDVQSFIYESKFVKESCNSTRKLCTIIDENNNFNQDYRCDSYIENNEDIGLNTSEMARKLEKDFAKYVNI
jgi:hypothetical protein